MQPPATRRTMRRTKRHRRAGSVGDLHVVNAAAPAPVHFLAGGIQRLARHGGLQVGDAAVLAHGGPVGRIAGVGKGRVGEAEDEAAVAHAVAVEHVLAHLHAQPGISRPGLEYLHAQRARRRVAGVERGDDRADAVALFHARCPRIAATAPCRCHARPASGLPAARGRPREHRGCPRAAQVVASGPGSCGPANARRVI